MIFKRFLYKRDSGNISRHLRVRVESCVNTILELNDRLGEGKIKPEIIQQFERLKESLRYVTDDSVDEKDIDRIEEATNQLLAEIKVTYGGQALNRPVTDAAGLQVGAAAVGWTGAGAGGARSGSAPDGGITAAAETPQPPVSSWKDHG